MAQVPVMIAPGNQPFRWDGRAFKITSAGIDANGVAYASVSPHDSELVEELRRRIDRDRALAVYLANGYTCFTDDYPVELRPPEERGENSQS